MSKHRPWEDWIPGVLSARQVKILIDQDYIKSNKNTDIDASSFDLTLSSKAYQLPRGSVKPFGDRYLYKIRDADLAVPVFPNAKGEFVLKRCQTYLFELNENVGRLVKTPIHGRATAKSSVGRMDVLARLVVDDMKSYEGFDPDKLNTGDMFLEITPMTFNVKVKEGISLAQLRLFMGHPEESALRGDALNNTILQNPGADNTLSLDLSKANLVDGLRASALFTYKSKEEDYEPLPLWGNSEINPLPHWNAICSDENNRLVIEPSNFYIMRSKEGIRVPPGIAVYCRAIDETIGEMRIHYAGFAHPGFGWDRDDGNRGTPLVFEVRGHGVPVCLNDEEKMAKLIFYRMSEDARPKDMKNSNSSYSDQSLRLSKYFAEFPSGITVNSDGSLTSGESK